MSAPDEAAFGPLARQDGEPPFDEPWQAQVLAVAHALSERGVFTPREWSAALGRALRDAEAAGKPDGNETYYGAALAALEGLLAERDAVAPDAVRARTEAWRRAYLDTPHGQPVELPRGATPLARTPPT